MKTINNIITVTAELLAEHKAAWPCGKLEVGDTFEFNEAGELVLMTCNADIESAELTAYCDRANLSGAIIIITSTLGRTDKNGRRKVRYMAKLVKAGESSGCWLELGTAETGNWTGYESTALELVRKGYQHPDEINTLIDAIGRAHFYGARVIFAPCGHYYA